MIFTTLHCLFFSLRLFLTFSCQTGYFSQSGDCVASCSSNYYQSSSTTCTRCSTSCLTCSGQTTSNCLSCSSGRYLYQGSCITCSTSCLTCNGVSSTNCLSCVSGKYLAADGSCQTCGGNCLSCQGSSTNCTSCQTEYVLNTVNSIGTCSLNSEIVVNPSLICNVNCNTCSNIATNCSSCSGSLILKSYNSIGTCCLSNQYVDADNLCQNCQVTCLTCVTASTNCLSCSNNLILSSGTCICAIDQYYDPSSNSCFNCDISCLSCSNSPTNCTLCNSTSVLKSLNSQGFCCLSTQYLDANNICTDCDSNCQTCVSTATNCLSCHGNLNLLFVTGQGNCQCQTNQILDVSGKFCTTCNTGCAVCSGSIDNCQSCIPHYFLANNIICEPCDIVCGTCFGTATNCSSCSNVTLTLNYFNGIGSCACPSGLFLYNGSCDSSCPINDYIENTESNTCDKRNKSNVQVYISDLNNPFKFLIVFVTSSNSIIQIQKNLRQTLNVNLTVSVMDNRSFSYNIYPSGINSSSFVLEMIYPEANSTKNLSTIKIYFQNSDNPYYDFFTDNFSFPLLIAHNCNEASEYFNNQTSECTPKTLIDFSWNYGDENNVIILTFTNINQRIVTSILNQSLINLNIDTFNYSIDYLYNIVNISNIFSLTFQYKKPVVGGRYLHLSLNQSIYATINYFNQTASLINQKFDIKLLDYYFLSPNTNDVVALSDTLVSSGSQSSSMAVYASMFLSPGASFAIRGMLLMNIIQLLKYLDISYPPNVVTIFKDDDQRVFFKESIIDEKSDIIPPTFVLYNVSGSILNNSFDDMFILWLMILGSMFVCFLGKFKLFWKKSYFFEQIFIILKSIFVWSMPIMMFISKYLKSAVFLCLFARFNRTPYSPIYEFFFYLFCLFYVVLFPFYLIWIIKIVSTSLNNDANLGKNDFSQKIDIKINRIAPLPISFFGEDPVDLKKEPSNDSPSKSPPFREFEELTQYQKQNSNSPIIDPFFLLASTPRVSTSSDVRFYDKHKPVKTTEFSEKRSQFKRSKTVEWDAIKFIEVDECKKAPKDKNKIEVFIEPVTLMTNTCKDRIDSSSKNVIIPDLPFTELSKSNDRTMENGKSNYGFSRFKEKKKNVLAIYCNMLIAFGKKILNSIMKFFSPSDKKEFSVRCKIVVKGLNRKKKLAKYYFFVDLNRHLLLALVVSQLYEYPMTQVLLLELICLIFLIFLLIFKPFETKTDMCLCYINECTVNLSLSSAVFLAWFDKNGYLDTDVRMNFGWTIVFMYIFLMYGLMANTFQKIVRLIFFALRKGIEKLKKAKIVNAQNF